MKAILVVILFIGVSLAYPPADKTPKIVGGQNASSAPFMVSLQIDRSGNYEHFCGGTIITPTYVATAAHCISRNGLTSNYRIVAGQLDLAVPSPYQQIRSVLRIILHEDYVAGDEHVPSDIALLRLAEPLDIVDDHVDQVRLPLMESIPYGDVMLYGWGSVSGETLNLPTALQVVTKPIIETDLCREIVDQHFISNMHVCTGPLTGGVGPCEHDAGGPIVQPYLGSYVSFKLFTCCKLTIK